MVAPSCTIIPANAGHLNQCLNGVKAPEEPSCLPASPRVFARQKPPVKFHWTKFTGPKLYIRHRPHRGPHPEREERRRERCVEGGARSGQVRQSPAWRREIQEW